jgi:hypothetical protein
MRYFAGEYSKPFYEKGEEIHGTWTRGELRMRGYTDYQINVLVEKGAVRLIGR